MAARRSRLQIKPNIGGKAASGPRRGQTNDEKATAVQITPELAAGAATAVNPKRGLGPTNDDHNVTAGQTGFSDKPGNNSGTLSNTDGQHEVHSNTTSGPPTNVIKLSPQKDVKSVSFTRLKRFGLNLGSQNFPRIENTDSTNTITSPQKTIKSPEYRLNESVGSPPPSPQKSANISSYSPQKSVQNTPKSSPKNNETLGNASDLSGNKKLPVTLSRKEGAFVPKFPSKPTVTSPNLKVHQIKDSARGSPSPTKQTNQDTVMEERDESHPTDNSQIELEKTTVKPSSVIQRLPFRTRMPKVKPNIDALRLKNKILHGGKEDSSSRPSSPLKSPKAGRFFSPIKSPKPVHRAVSPDVDVQSEKSEQDEDRLVIDTDTASEGRKRHFSNSSVSTVNSDIQGSVKNKRQKSPKRDYPTDEPIDRNCMKMGDLVYWNPVKNPMTVVTMKKKQKLEKEKENVCEESTKEDVQEDVTDSKEEDMPVPQVKIGPDGSIILNEESIVIKKQDENPISEVIEENGSTATYASFRKPFNRAGWSDWETEKFYRALSYLGTDFSLMIKLFPNRSRCDIKTKFKREDKYNKSKVDFALKNKKPFNMSFFEEEEELDKKYLARMKKEAIEKLKKSKQLRAEKQREKKKSKEKIEVEDVPVMRESYRSCRDRRKRYYDEDENDGDTSEVDSVIGTPMGTPIKTPIRLSLKRRDSLPFVPPFCLSQEEESDTMETQVSMSDSEILSPQKPSRSDISQVTDSILTGGAFPPNANVQVAQLTDANNSPLVLVYHTPEDGKGETVIHVYQLQNNQLGNASHIQIPLNDGSSVLQIPNIQTSGDNDLKMNELDEQSESTSTQESLPFIIAPGEGNPPQLFVQPVSEDNKNESENNEFINVIDINASKIKTPKKQSNGKDQTKVDTSIEQSENLNSDNVADSDNSRTSSPVNIDNEFVATDVDVKYNQTEKESQSTKKCGRRKR